VWGPRERCGDVTKTLATLKGRGAPALTVDALEVQEVGAVVHLVELQAHLHQVARHRVLPAHAQVVRVHHLRGRRGGRAREKNTSPPTRTVRGSL